MATLNSLGFRIFTTYDGGGVRSARRDIDDITTSTNRSTSAMNSWAGRIILATKAALVFGPALIPISASLAAIGGAALAMGASVGVGLGAYGLAMKNAIKTTEEMAKAGKTLTASQKDYLKSHEQFTKALSTFGSSFRDESLKAASATLNGMTSILKGLEPVAKALAPEVTKVAQAFENWAKSDSFKNYVNLIKNSAVPILRDLVAAGKDVLNVLGDGFRAFLPNGVKLADVLRQGAAALKGWSDSGGFQRFLSYVSENSGQVREFFRALGDALKAIGLAMKDLGPLSLTITTTILKLVAALPPEWIANIVRAFIAWKVAMMGLMVINTVVTMVRALAAAWFVLNLAFTASTIGLVVLAIAALVAGIILLVQHWDTVSGALKTAWNATWNAMKVAVDAVWTALKTGWSAVAGAFVTAWTAVSGALVTAWNATWNAIKVAVDVVWEALKTAWNAVVTSFGTAWTTVSSALTTAWTTVWNGLKTAAEAVWTAIKAGWDLLVNAFMVVWNTTSAILGTAWHVFWETLKSGAETTWNFMKALWDSFVNALKLVWDTVGPALQAAWTTVWNAIKVAAETVWNALKVLWDGFINGLKVIWDTVGPALQAAWQTVWTAIQTAATTIWTALQTAWQAFITALQTIWTTVSVALQTAWQTFWTAIQTAATTIWTALQTAWQALWTAIQLAWTTFSTAFNAAWQPFWTALQTAATTIWTALQTAWQALWTAVQTAWTTFSTALQTAWQTFWNLLKTTAQTAWDAIKAAWEAFTNAIKDFWDKVSTALKTAWESTWNTMKEKAKEIWDGIKKVIEDAVNGIIGIVKKIVGVWNNIADKVGLNDLKIDTSSWGVNLAVGGIVEFANGGITGGSPTFLARGGVIPGYAPGKDTVNAMLSKGEGVLVPEAVRGLGADFVHAANYHFSHGRGGKNVNFPGYSKGGIHGERAAHMFAGGGINAFGRDPQNKRGWATDFFQGGGIIPPTPGPGLGGPDPLSGDAPKNDNITNVKDDDDGGGILGTLADIGKTILNNTGLAGAVLGFLGREAIEKAFDFATGLLDNFGIAGDFGKILVAGTKKLVKGMIEDLVKRDEEAKQKFTAMSVAGAQSVQAWAPLALQAMKMAGMNPNQLQAFLALMAAESGGNPNAINLTDINAKNGVPSQGLMQVIPPTFAANHVAGTSNNILDPLANMAAAAKYIMNRYGGIVPGSPYANGTNSATPGLHLVGENGPELVGVGGPGMAAFSGGQSVLPADETQDFLGGMGGSTGELAIPADETQKMLDNGGFQGISEAAQLMAEQIQQAWNDANASSSSAWATMRDGTLAETIVNYGTDVPAASNLMKDTSNAAWVDMGVQSAAQWAAMRDTTFTESELHQGTTMPLMATTMQEASNAAWLGMQTESTTQFTTMQDSAFLPAEDHMGVQMPTTGATMNTEVSQSFTELSANVVSTMDTGIAKMDEFIAKAQEAISVTAELVAAVAEATAAMASLASSAASGATGGTAGAGVSGNVESWRPLALEAMAAGGLDPSQIDAFLALMQAESGGDPNAINNWDSNAAAGTPSIGLMQVIQPTFDAYNVTGGVITDPFANMAASAAYIVARYGGIVPGSPYASGTSSATAGFHLVGENGPELVGTNGPGYALFAGGESVLPAGMTASLITTLNAVIAQIAKFIEMAQAAIEKAKQMIAAAAAAKAAAAAMGSAAGGAGAITDGNLAAALARAGNPPIIQGPYSNGALSAGTHSGGGVVDVPVEYFQAMLNAGFIGWLRTGAAWAGNEHAHMLLPGTPDFSPQAAWQVQDYYAGGTGLNIPALYTGTNSAQRGWSWVGEKGPELMWMNGGEKVIPNGDSMRWAGRKGGGGCGDWAENWTSEISSDVANAITASGDNHRGCQHVELNFNGPVNNGDDVRRAVDEAIPKLRSAMMAGVGKR